MSTTPALFPSMGYVRMDGAIKPELSEGMLAEALRLWDHKDDHFETIFNNGDPGNPDDTTDDRQRLAAYPSRMTAPFLSEAVDLVRAQMKDIHRADATPRTANDPTVTIPLLKAGYVATTSALNQWPHRDAPCPTGIVDPDAWTSVAFLPVTGPVATGFVVPRSHHCLEAAVSHRPL
jgi:hypothetical protein